MQKLPAESSQEYCLVIITEILSLQNKNVNSKKEYYIIGLNRTRLRYTKMLVGTIDITPLL